MCRSNWLIKQQTQDSADPILVPGQQNKYKKHKQKRLFGLVLLGFGGLLFVGVAFFASASGVSSLSSFSNQPVFFDYSDDSLILNANSGPLAYRFGVGGPAVLIDNDAIVASPDVWSDNTEASVIESSINNFSGQKRDIGQVVKHLVEPGETLSQISEDYGVTTDTIRFNNEKVLKQKYLHAGDELSIPWTDGIFYKVTKGDNLSSIAKKYDISSDTLKENNPFLDKDLKIGQEIFLPGAKPKATLSSVVKVLSVDKTSVSDSLGSVKSLKKWSSGQDLGAGLIAPVTGIITQGYGMTSFAIKSGYYGKTGHRGVDIGAPKGTPIIVAMDGIVEFSGVMNGYGNVVIVKHNDGRETRYGHNTKNLVKKGESVAAGQQIATVGSTGRSTGYHLHFEVRNTKGGDDMDFYNSYLEK